MYVNVPEIQLKLIEGARFDLFTALTIGRSAVRGNIQKDIVLTAEQRTDLKAASNGLTRDERSAQSSLSAIKQLIAETNDALGVPNTRAAVTKALACGEIDYELSLGIAKKIHELSDEKKIILDLLEQGYGDKEIADKIGLTNDGVRSHLTDIYKKLEARNVTHVIRRSYEGGFFFPGASTDQNDYKRKVVKAIIALTEIIGDDYKVHVVKEEVISPAPILGYATKDDLMEFAQVDDPFLAGLEGNRIQGAVNNYWRAMKQLSSIIPTQEGYLGIIRMLSSNNYAFIVKDETAPAYELFKYELTENSGQMASQRINLDTIYIIMNSAPRLHGRGLGNKTKIFFYNFIENRKQKLDDKAQATLGSKNLPTRLITMQ